MQPKQIIIQSLSDNFLSTLNVELENISNVRYNYFKANGVFVISIKCGNYYNSLANITHSSFYGNYIYLYTSLSLLLSDLIISHYERKFVKREIYNNYFYFNSHDQKQIINIATSILDKDLPAELNESLYMYRKETILNSLLKNFRKKNYLNIDSFVNFSLQPYIIELEEIVDKSVELFLYDIKL